MDLQVIADDAIAHATGRARRTDESRPRSGGPAGNARLTAWIGLMLLVLCAAELITLLDVRGLLSWHVAVGIVLVPPALVKTASTGWRIVRYYTGSAPYRRSGPPPLLLRVLGPLVVVTTLGVLVSGLALVLVGPAASRSGGLGLAGRSIDLVTVHKGAFVLWGCVTGLHLLGRIVPALQLTVTRLARSERVPGRPARSLALAMTAAVAVGAAIVGLSVVDLSGWHGVEHRDRPRPAAHP
jgi:hypothetical protein